MAEQLIMTYEGRWDYGKRSGRIVLLDDKDFGNYLEASLKELLDDPMRADWSHGGDAGSIDKHIRIEVHLVDLED